MARKSLTLQVAEKLEQIRKHKSLTQTQVAENLDENIGTVHKWFNGKGLDLDSAAALCDGIGESLPDLLAELLEENLPGEKAPSPTQRAIVRFLSTLDEEEVGRVRKLLELTFGEKLAAGVEKKIGK